MLFSIAPILEKLPNITPHQTTHITLLDVVLVGPEEGGKCIANVLLLELYVPFYLNKSQYLCKYSAFRTFFIIFAHKICALYGMD